jgi:hypothetical protein
MLRLFTFAAKNMQLSTRDKLLAFGSVLALFGLIWLYTREFYVLSNTIAAKRLIWGSMITAALLLAICIGGFRKRFMPWENHLTELLFIVIFGVLFAPLFGSLLNRGLGVSTTQSFDFVSEIPYAAMGYGVMKNEKITPTGWYLTVREEDSVHRFRYRSQAYYPISRPGDTVLLPIREGLFGFRVMELK